MNTLVTGATGFVGKRLVRKLLEHGHQVRALTRQQSVDLPPAVEQVTGDVLAPPSLIHALQGMEIVFHCAAAVGNQFSKQQIYQVNLEGVQNLFDAALVTKPRIVLLSSVNVLGTRNFVHVTEEELCKYSNDPAADVKIEVEALAHRYLREHQLPITIVRPGFIYGPGDPHNLPKLVSALRRGKFSYIGSKGNIIPIVHVDDVAEALVQAGTRQASVGRTYHVLDEKTVTIESLVAAISRIINAPIPTKVLPYWLPSMACKVFSGLKASGLWRKAAPIAPNSLRFLGTSRSFDLSRAQAELGYRSTMQLEIALHDAIETPVEPHGVLHHATA